MKNSAFRWPVIGLVWVALLVAGCRKDEETDLEKQTRRDEELIQQYLPTQSLSFTKSPEGYYYARTAPNESGQAVQTKDIVSMYYRLYRLDGTLIDSLTASMGAPAKLRHGDNAAIPVGLDAGLAYMKTGESYRFILPSGFAYGSFAANGVIDAYSVVIMDVNLVDIISDNEQAFAEDTLIQNYIDSQQLTDVQAFTSGLYYHRRQAGQGAKPQNGQRVTVQYVGKYLDGTEFDKSTPDQPLRFTIGSEEIIKGFNEGIAQMIRGEKGTLFMPSSLAYGASIQVIPLKIRKGLLEYAGYSAATPPFTPLVFDVELTSIQ